MCGTAKEVVGANMIDHRRIGEGVVGSNTWQQFEVYKKTVRGEGVYSKEWLDYAE